MTAPLASLFVDVSRVPWGERRPGVLWKTLWADTDGRAKASLMRQPAGAGRPPSPR